MKNEEQKAPWVFLEEIHWSNMTHDPLWWADEPVPFVVTDQRNEPIPYSVTSPGDSDVNP